MITLGRSSLETRISRGKKERRKTVKTEPVCAFRSSNGFFWFDEDAGRHEEEQEGKETNTTFSPVVCTLMPRQKSTLWKR